MLRVTAVGRPRGSACPQESVSGEVALRDVGLRCRVCRAAGPDRRQPLPRLERRRPTVRAAPGRCLDLADRDERPLPLDLVPARRERDEDRTDPRRHRGDPRLRAPHRLPPRHGRARRVRDGARGAHAAPAVGGCASALLPAPGHIDIDRVLAAQAGVGVGRPPRRARTPACRLRDPLGRNEHLPDGLPQCGRRARALRDRPPRELLPALPRAGRGPGRCRPRRRRRGAGLRDPHERGVRHPLRQPGQPGLPRRRRGARRDRLRSSAAR